MNRLFKTTPEGSNSFLLALLALVIVVNSSCGKQDRLLPGEAAQVSSAQQKKPSVITSSTMTREAALGRINTFFKGEFHPVKPEQVQGISKQQFVQWLRSSSMAETEQLYFASLLSSNVSEFLLLRNVTVLSTGKQATIAMVAVPQELLNTYSSLIIIKDLHQVFNTKICAWFQCDTSTPELCLCFREFRGVPKNSTCPPSTCHPTLNPCRNPSTGDLCGPGLFEPVIAAW